MDKGNHSHGARKRTGENLKVVWAEFSTLSLAVLVMSVTARYRQACPHLNLKTRPRFCPVSSGLLEDQQIINVKSFISLGPVS